MNEIHYKSPVKLPVRTQESLDILEELLENEDKKEALVSKLDEAPSMQHYKNMTQTLPIVGMIFENHFGTLYTQPNL